MSPPITVRVGIWLIGLTLLTNLIASLWPRAQMMGGIGQAATTFLIFGCLLYAIGRRRNWARLVFTFLYIVGVFFALTLMGRFRSAGTIAVLLNMGLIIVQGAGLACLFLPSAAAWYHPSRRSSLTSA
jgi:hypothetical protein